MPLLILTIPFEMLLNPMPRWISVVGFDEIHHLIIPYQPPFILCHYQVVYLLTGLIEGVFRRLVTYWLHLLISLFTQLLIYIIAYRAGFTSGIIY